MKVSVCMNTAREDYSMIGLPKVHIFEYLMDSLRKQTYKNFEVVICDVLFEKRSKYFHKNPEKFRIYHVPVKPNVWIPRNLCAISTTKNTCILYATGEIIIFIDDCGQLHPKTIEYVVENLDDKIVFCNSYKNYKGDKFICWGISPEKDQRVFYNNLSIYTKNILAVNGYDEMYDGSKGYEDSDLGVRLKKELGLKFKINPYPFIYQVHSSTIVNESNFIKCPQLWLDISKKRIERQINLANIIEITQDEYNYISEVCPYSIKENNIPKCSKRLSKKTNLHRPCPFFGHVNRRKHLKFRKLIKLYKHPSLVFNLKYQKRYIQETIEDLKNKCSFKKVEGFLDK